MLQENGIEDFRPLDVSLETEEDPYEGEKYTNGNDQISVSDSNKDEGYGSRDMPEYNVETKADFKGNQEAIDWLMKDPNDFNVKSFEDSSVLEDTDSFSQNSYSTNKEHQDETENNVQSNFHHKNKGSKRHHDSSVDDSTRFGHSSNSHSFLDHNQDEGDTSNDFNAAGNRHLAKTTKWRDKYDDFQDSDYSENDYIGQGQKSWDSDGIDEGTTDRSYDEYDKDTEGFDEQRPRASSMKNLNKRIESQDAKLYKELENFANIDNYENIDDTDDLGNFDVHSSDIENPGGKYEDMDDREEQLNSDSEDNISMSNGKNFDRQQQEGDREKDFEWKDGGKSPHTDDQFDTENADNDVNDDVNSDGSGTGSDKPNNKIEQNEMEDEAEDSNKANSNSKSINGDPEIVTVKTNHANNNGKLKELKNDKTHNTGINQVIQNTDIVSSEVKDIDKSQEQRITNKGNETEMLDNSETAHKTTINLKNENEKHIPADTVGNNTIIMSAASKVDGVNKYRNGETNSGTHKVPVSVLKIVGEIGKDIAKNTSEEPLTPKDKPKASDKNELQLMHQKVIDKQKDMEQKPDTKLYAAPEKPTLSEKIKTQIHNGQAHNYRNDKKPMSTGFRRNQQSYDSLSRINSLADLSKIENIISYLRGTGGPRSVPTRSSTSLKNLYYYPMHPTPQEQNDDISGVKGKGT